MISENISYKEATKSLAALNHGIDNTPSARQLDNMQLIAARCFEPCRTALGNKPIYISSFYRSPDLNTRIGGSSSSFHCHGMAMDLDADVFKQHTNKQIFDYFYQRGEYTELIWEYGDKQEPAWVHVAWAKGDKRRMVKRATPGGIITFDLY